MVNPGTYVLDSNLNLSGTIPGGSLGVAVDPSGTVGYQVGGSRIDVLNLSNFSKTDSLDIGDTTDTGSPFGFGSGVGRMAISRDGAILAVIADHGFSIIQTKITSSVPLAALVARAHIKLRDGTKPDSFKVDGSFSLDGDSNGIDLHAENVTLQVGSVVITIPAGSFTQSRHHFKFEGTANGVTIRFSIRRLSRSHYRFAAHGEGADLTGTSIPMTVGLIIGDDRGGTKLTEGEAEFNSNSQGR